MVGRPHSTANYSEATLIVFDGLKKKKKEEEAD